MVQIASSKLYDSSAKVQQPSACLWRPGLTCCPFMSTSFAAAMATEPPPTSISCNATTTTAAPAAMSASRSNKPFPTCT